MVAPMSGQGTQLLAFLQAPRTDTFFADLVPLLETFCAASTGNPQHNLNNLTSADENLNQSLPLIQPLLELLSSDSPDVPYQSITRALSVILNPLPFEVLRGMGLYPILQQGLESNVPEIRLLALDQAKKMTVVDDEMVSALIDCLGAEDAGVGQKTVDVITSLFSNDAFQDKFIRLAKVPRTSIQIPRFLDLIVSLAHLDPQLFQNLLPHLNNTLDSIRDTDVLMIMNVIQFYTHLQESSSSPEILAFLEPKIPQVMQNLSPDADAFQSLLGAGTCEFLTSLRMHREFKRLDREYGILRVLEVHAFHSASPQHVPALIAFSKIASTDGVFTSIDAKALNAYKKLMATRPVTPEKLTALAILLSNNHTPEESQARETWFTLPLADLVTPYVHDPTLQLSPITLLSALTGHIWGVRIIAASSVIMEWLTDRLGDYQEATGKFAVVKRMLQTTVAAEGPQHRRRGAMGRWRSHIETFVSRGEWWRDNPAEIATQGS